MVMGDEMMVMDVMDVMGDDDGCVEMWDGDGVMVCVCLRVMVMKRMRMMCDGAARLMSERERERDDA